MCSSTYESIFFCNGKYQYWSSTTAHPSVPLQILLQIKILLFTKNYGLTSIPDLLPIFLIAFSGAEHPQEMFVRVFLLWISPKIETASALAIHYFNSPHTQLIQQNNQPKSTGQQGGDKKCN